MKYGDVVDFSLSARLASYGASRSRERGKSSKKKDAFLVYVGSMSFVTCVG
jgi:predicted ATP-dependent Lon-type protease